MEKEERKSFWKKLFSWESVDEIILAGALYPALKALALKVVEKLGKRAEGVLGLDLDSANRSVTDDFYFLAAQANLEEGEITKIYDFKHWLRHRDKDENDPKGPDEESAFILYIAKMLKTFEWEKKYAAGGGTKGSGKKQEGSYKELEKGVTLATKFFKSLLSNGSNEEMRHFLENENVFTLIPKKKINSIVEGLKDSFRDPTDEDLEEAQRRYDESKRNRQNRR